MADVLVEHFLEFSLVVEKRRTLREENGKCRHADVIECVLSISTGAWVGNRLEQLA